MGKVRQLRPTFCSLYHAATTHAAEIVGQSVEYRKILLLCICVCKWMKTITANCFAATNNCKQKFLLFSLSCSGSYLLLWRCCQNERSICKCWRHGDWCAEDLAVLGRSDWPYDTSWWCIAVEFLLPYDRIRSIESKSVAPYCRRS